jgi:hypothetical protein
MIIQEYDLHSMLVRYLGAHGFEENRLLEQVAAGIEAIVRKRISRYNVKDAEDFSQDCVISLLAAVDRLKVSGECTITNFDGFVVRTVDNRVRDEFRKANPARRRLGMAVEHLLNGKLNVAGLAIWNNKDNGDKIAGFDAWLDRPVKSIKDTFDSPQSKNNFAVRFLDGDDPKDADLAELVSALLNWHDGPLKYDDLIDLVCKLRNVERRTELSLNAEIDDKTYLDLLEDPSGNVEDRVITSTYSEKVIQEIWGELKELSFHQFASICLKLEYDELIALASVVGHNAVAEVLGVTTSELSAYIARIPMPDSEIAGIVGRETAQIPSVRKKAMQRLSRRLSKNLQEF